MGRTEDVIVRIELLLDKLTQSNFGGAAEILVSRDTLDGAGSSFRLSEPRAEVFKGFEEPIDVVAVDWR